MGISPLLLFRMLYYSFFWGMIVGVLNDLNKAISILLFKKATGFKFINQIIGKCFKQKEKAKAICASKMQTIVVFFGDVCLSVIYGFGLIFLNYSFNNGTFRFFSVPVSLLGVIIYHFSVGKIIDKLLFFVCNMIKSILVAVIVLIFYPILYFLRKIYRFSKKSFAFFEKTIANYKEKRYNNYVINKITKKSLNAFLNSKELECGDKLNE